MEGSLPLRYLVDWYWRVGSDAGHVFSAGAVDLVSVEDPKYIKWCDTYTNATDVGSYGALSEQLTSYSRAPADHPLVVKLAALGQGAKKK
jgi:hypothetical protein